MSSRLDVVSLFAGVGGIDLAAHRAGMRTRLLCEKDEPCRRVLAARFPDAVIHPDVTELTADDIRAAGAVPRRTVLTAGWPCQGNSVAGRRGGMGDARSGLWVHVARLLAEFRPAWFVGENVPGLLSVNAGRDFGAVLGDLAGLGYGWAYRVLDARFFGVPQRRRRVVIVGCLGDSGAAPAQVLLEPESRGGDSAARGQAGTETAGLAAVGSHGTGSADLTRTHVGALMASEGRGWRIGADEAAAGQTALTTRAGATFDDQQVGQLVVGVLGEHSHTLTAEGADAGEDGTGRGTPIIAYPLAVRGRDGGADLEAGAPGDPMFALRTGGGGSSRSQLVAVHENQRGELNTQPDIALNSGGGKPGQGYPAVLDGVIVRRLTPLECERLQGFPDDWTDVDGASDSQRYRQMGNSVAVPVFEWVLSRLAAVEACEVIA